VPINATHTGVHTMLTPTFAAATSSARNGGHGVVSAGTIKRPPAGNPAAFRAQKCLRYELHLPSRFSNLCTSAPRARIKNAVRSKEQKSCGDKDTTMIVMASGTAGTRRNAGGPNHAMGCPICNWVAAHDGHHEPTILAFQFRRRAHHSCFAGMQNR